jgi:hypothetical protein
MWIYFGKLFAKLAARIFESSIRIKALDNAIIVCLLTCFKGYFLLLV